jgi:DNA-binding transcriptional ArsR family regulator
MPAAVDRGRGRRVSRVPLLLDDRQIAESVQRLKLVADETRLRILSTLSEGERNVSSLCDALGQSQPAVSHHLALLRVSGLVQSDRQGKNIFYSLTDMGWAVFNGCRIQLEA